MNFINLPRSRPDWRKIIPIALSILVSLLLVTRFNLDELKILIQQNQQFSLIISLVCYFLLSFTFIPSTPLIAFMSIIGDPFLEVIIATAGNTIAAIIQYHIGSSVIEPPHIKEWEKKLPTLIRKLPINSPLFLLIGRFMPGGPRIFSVICGARRTPFNIYLWTSIIAYLISASVFAFGGTGLSALFQ